MNKPGSKKTADKTGQQTDDSHIIRSENGINPNRELYGGTSGNAERAEKNRDKSIASDPSSFPGGTEKDGK